MKIVRLKRRIKGKEGQIIIENYFIKVINKYFPIFVEKGYIQENDASILSECEVELKYNGEWKDG